MMLKPPVVFFLQIGLGSECELAANVGFISLETLIVNVQYLSTEMSISTFLRRCSDLSVLRKVILD